MTDELFRETKEKMNQGIEAMVNELKKVRTGRANVSMVDSVKVPYYGNPTPLTQVAKVSCPDAKSFVITPWEAPMLKEIEQALVKCDLGMTPMNDGKVIRLRLPDLTEERRKDLAKSIKKIVEDARVSVRMARREANDEVKKRLKDKVLSEDESRSLTDKIQKATNECIKKVDQVGSDKEKDIMTI